MDSYHYGSDSKDKSIGWSRWSTTHRKTVTFHPRIFIQQPCLSYPFKTLHFKSPSRCLTGVRHLEVSAYLSLFSLAIVKSCSLKRRESIYLTDHCSSSRDAKVETQNMNMETVTGAETMKEWHILLYSSFCLASFLKQLRSTDYEWYFSRMSKGNSPPISNQENDPKYTHMSILWWQLSIKDSSSPEYQTDNQ